MKQYGNWMAIEESNFPWEREALAFVRDRFPNQEPYRAWSNFEFIAADGSINEVDLLVFTAQGFFLVEIKSRPGRLFGDAGTWTWETEGKRYTYDNPLRSANLKAKKLRSLLERQRACRTRGQIPFIEPLVFCSAPNLKLELRGEAAYGVCLRDKEGISGVMAAFLNRSCPGLSTYPRGTFDRITSRIVSQAIDQAGIRPSQRHRKVGDYELEEVIVQGNGYQDWRATHAQLENSKRRVRLYLVRTEGTEETRRTIERAARREFEVLEGLQHPGILRTYGYTDHELGPALLFEYDPKAIRLDHYLAQFKDALGVEKRLQLLRQIAEVIRFAHDRKVVHRGLSPQSILVAETKQGYPEIKVFNWQVAYRAGTTGGAKEVTATSHVDRLIEDASTAYLAPEILSEDGIAGEHLDIFSLGAISFLLFSGEAPATDGMDLSNKLRESRGLQISAVLDGAPESLQVLIQQSTHPVIDDRTETVEDFLRDLDEVEKDLKALEQNLVENPNQAQQGDMLPGNLKVIKRLGQGACSIALLVEREDQEFVLKVANDPDNNGRVRDEIEVLSRLHQHQHIVSFCEALDIGDRVAFLMRPVLVDREKRIVETLGQRLRREGRLHIDLLQRFGEDLLDVVRYLEEQGVYHRDIKPDNIAVGQVGRGDKLHVVLFDFSLSKTSIDNIRAGTAGYLDPLLPLRKPQSWDSYAERYAAAITLYELTTGKLPKWGDGVTNPVHLDCEITIEPELFDATLRDELTAFFRKAFLRDIQRRFDNAETMLKAWRGCFEGIVPSLLSDHTNEALIQERLEQAEVATPLAELGLGTRVMNALDRINVITVKELLTVPMGRLSGLRGVGNQTRREITNLAKRLRDRLGSEESSEEASPEVAKLNLDLLTHRTTQILLKEAPEVHQVLQACLGLDGTPTWLSQSELAAQLKMSREFVAQWMARFQGRWVKEPAVTRLRSDLVEILERFGGVMSIAELAEAVLAARGSSEAEPLRSQRAMAMVRVAVEVESTMGMPRFAIHRQQERRVVSLMPALAEYAYQLGDVADELAQEDPLVPPSRALQRLQEVVLPMGFEALPETRLVRLAAAASRGAALSSRQEFYPRGMSIARSLKLAQGALYGVKSLTVEQIRDRVLSRYPDAADLPSRPTLDEVLRQSGLNLRWTGKEYLNQAIDTGIASSSILSRQTTQRGVVLEEVTPEIADARQFEERLQRSVKAGAYQVLLVEPRRYEQVLEEIVLRFDVTLVDFEAMFLESLERVAQQKRVNWDLVLRTDAVPGEGDWDKLMALVRLTMQSVEQQLLAIEKTILLVYPGLLARYGQMELLERLRDNLGREDGVTGLWIVVPNGSRALIDDGGDRCRAVPILSPGQVVQVPLSWIRNEHRG